MTTRDTIYSHDDGGRRGASVLDPGVTRLPPERDGAGNVEYKTKLDLASEARTTHLATQLQWRLAEGNGQALYVVGVHDDGEVVGISEAELAATVATIRRMAHELDGARVVSVEQRALAGGGGGGGGGRVVAEVRVAQHQAALPQTELRVAVLGDHGAGKSSILGCLTYGEADDGRGKARLNLLRHQHELESGRTSSITLETVGFAADGALQNYTNNRTAEQIHQRSRHIVSFIDTCGHAKHLKTTARAIAGHSPQALCVVVAADAPAVPAPARDYVLIAAALGLPLAVVVSKMDIAAKAAFSALMRDLVAALDAALPGRSKCVVADAPPPAALAADTMRLAVVPIFTTSAVRSVGFDALTAVLRCLRAPRPPADRAAPLEFHIEHVYSVDRVGAVATGWVASGAVESAAAAAGAAARPLAVGPDAAGAFADVDVTSIHTLRIPTATARAGFSAALAIQPRAALPVCKGMVILDAARAAKCTSSEFTADVVFLDPAAAAAQTATVHIRAAYHLAHIVEVVRAAPQEPAAAGARAVVRLRLDGGAQDYVRPGMPVIARDGRGLIFAGRISAARP
ncbi:hypothetical protein H4R18_000034 [Coemansia javaensis]|uniref:Tr-type G domain-containing protein n=1 Tax=Coemansia javaensis TaxID=2761396 RepID=A0A9W8HJE8_9FUNG|nr:hypothetical protein H4R18_000034 [Coemansia javaensis]